MAELALKAPAVEMVTLEEVKMHLRIDPSIGDFEDGLLKMLVAVAVEQAEHLIGRPILPRTYSLHVDRFPADLDPIPLGEDVNTIVSVEYMNPSGVKLSMPLAEVSVMGRKQLTAPNGWPAGGAVSVEFEAGMCAADAATVPACIKQWVLLRVATLYENRESVMDGRLKELPRTFVDGLLDEWRIRRV